MKYKNVQPGGALATALTSFVLFLATVCDVNLLRMASRKENVDPDIKDFQPPRKRKKPILQWSASSVLTTTLK